MHTTFSQSITLLMDTKLGSIILLFVSYAEDMKHLCDVVSWSSNFPEWYSWVIWSINENLKKLISPFVNLNMVIIIF